VSVEQVGAVEVLAGRVYPLDHEIMDHPAATWIYVGPGTYPLYRDCDAHFWMMTGHVNRRTPRKIGDGTFVASGSDGPTDTPEVTFPSARFGPEQWADLLIGPTCTEGHPSQRLRILLGEEASRCT